MKKQLLQYKILNYVNIVCVRACVCVCVCLFFLSFWEMMHVLRSVFILPLKKTMNSIGKSYQCFFKLSVFLLKNIYKSEIYKKM